MEEEETKKMSKAQFWVRFVLWVGLALIVPLVYMAVEYGLFETKSTTLSGWGTLAVIFVCVTLLYIVNQTKKALPDGSMLKQCISGVMGLIPLFGVLLIVHSVKSNIEGFERFLIVILVCEALAIPVNPLPKWAKEHDIDLFDETLFKSIRKAIGPKRDE